MLVIVTVLSLTLSYIKVPPLKSTPKFKPLNKSKIIEISINDKEIKLNNL